MSDVEEIAEAEIAEASGELLLKGGGPDIHSNDLKVDDLKAYIHDAEEGGYWAEVPALPGCLTQGETLDEIVENIDDAIQSWLSVQTRESLIAQGVPFTIGAAEAVAETMPRRSRRRGSRVRSFEFAA